MTNTVSVTESNNSVTVTEQNNTVSILEDAPIVTPEPWYQDLTTVPTSSASATVTADSTPHIKGAWTEIIASNATETSALYVYISGVGQSATNTAMLLDIGTGNVGEETVIASNIAIGGSQRNYFVLPLQIAASTRIAARVQAVIPSDTATVEISSLALGTSSAVPTTVDILGADVATSAGFQFSGANTWFEVVASTTQEYEAIGLVGSLSTTNHPASYFKLLEIGVGASGSENVVHEQTVYYTSSETVNTYIPPLSFISKTSIPSGSRLAIRTNFTFGTGVVFIGVPST